MSDRLPQLMLADLRRFCTITRGIRYGSLKVSTEVRGRLRELGYIR